MYDCRTEMFNVDVVKVVPHVALGWTVIEDSSSGVSHTCFVRRFTASCDIILGEAKGMRFEFGVATNDSGCVAPGMCVRGERRCSGSGLSIGVVGYPVL